ncbi:MAG: tetratricopeptide repeat protein [Verrucomicrobiota bacterium]
MNFRICLCILFLTVAGSLAAATPIKNSQVTELLLKAEDFWKAGNSPDALKLAGEAVALDPKDTRGWYLRGRVHEQAKQYAEALTNYSQVIKLDPAMVPVYQRRGEIFFRLGKFKESVADFDRYLTKLPQQEPQHWQRGVSHYYAGMYAAGARQFEIHREVNPDDVENSIWHYLCLSKAKDKATARQQFIPCRADARVPMMQLHALFAGKGNEAGVFRAVQAGDPDPVQLKGRLFYAHLYLGLWYESEGKPQEAREHVFKAAGEFAVEGYMGDAARVHAELFRQQDARRR